MKYSTLYNDLRAWDNSAHCVCATCPCVSKDTSQVM